MGPDAAERTDAAEKVGAKVGAAGFAETDNRRAGDEAPLKYGYVAMKVGVIMGSVSDYEVMADAVAMLERLGIDFEKRVVSAHRTPDLLYEYAKTARSRGIGVIIAGAGGAAHLPGMVASMTPLPVVGVPVKSRALNGLDSLLSIVQMPAGVPVATTAINGAKNAALIAASILALQDRGIAERLDAFRAAQTADVLKAEI